MRKKTLCLILAILLLLGAGCQKEKKSEGLADGTYRIEAALAGGTGKATRRPNGVRYDAVIEDGHAVFTVPVASLEEPFPVVADTVAMSSPHEIEYTITFDPATLAADPS